MLFILIAMVRCLSSGVVMGLCAVLLVWVEDLLPTELGRITSHERETYATQYWLWKKLGSFQSCSSTSGSNLKALLSRSPIHSSHSLVCDF